MEYIEHARLVVLREDLLLVINDQTRLTNRGVAYQHKLDFLWPSMNRPSLPIPLISITNTSHDYLITLLYVLYGVGLGVDPYFIIISRIK